MRREPKIVLDAASRTWLWWLGHPAWYAATGEDTEGAYALCGGIVPAGDGPPPHRHVFHEAFYLLRGELEFTVGNRKVILKEGGFGQVSGNVAHFFRNASDQEAEVMVLACPAGFDRFQFEAGRRLAGPTSRFDPVTPDDIARMIAAAPKYGIDLSPPPDSFLVEPKCVTRQPGEGRCVAVVGDTYRFLATGEDTDGAYAIWHATVPPGGGPPPHVHSQEEEGFFVLEGELTFQVENRTIRAQAGAFFNLPVGVAHSFRNDSNQPAKLLIFVAPAGLEKMFFETGVPLADSSSPASAVSKAEIERLKGAAPRYGVKILAPP